MTRKNLKNKPLVEAIFELRWKLKKIRPHIKIDPHYKLLIGRLYDKFNKDYPFHEQLPAATMADEIAGYVVQHRFRTDKNKWPLIQIGPGIITVNDTEGYIWEDFEDRINKTVSTLYAIYPNSKDNLNVDRLLLRYIDALPFNFNKDNIFEFLSEKMKTNINLPQNLFIKTGVKKLPSNIDFRLSYVSTVPKGAIYLRFTRGKKGGVDALIWETMVESNLDKAPKIKKEISDWVKKAHKLTDDWFFKLIEGELLRRFE